MFLVANSSVKCYLCFQVYRSNRTLASISSSSVSHTSKDLRLAKVGHSEDNIFTFLHTHHEENKNRTKAIACLFQMTAVVCASFLLAWLPYATVSLISALIPIDEQETEGTLQTVVEFSSTASTPILDFSSLVNWTTTEYSRQIYYNPGLKGSEESNMGKEVKPILRSHQPLSCLPPVVTLIPAMFAKSHCMINPLIYQIMNWEFRHDVYVVLFGREKAERRRLQGRHGSLSESKNHYTVL